MWFFSSFLIFMIVFEDKLIIPNWLYPVGRLHPMILHFPIVLVVLLGAWIAFVKQFDQKLLRVVLSSTALIVIITSIMGLFLSLEEPVKTDLMYNHKWSAMTLTLIMVLSTVVRVSIAKIFIFLALPVVIVVGHFGASLTHGENFVFEPWESPESRSELLPIFNAYVEPIFNNKCTGCHNPNKRKGKLDLTSFAKMQAGGESGPLWNLKAPDSSKILEKILLPVEHEDHMPPEGKSQLTLDEIKLLSAWISSGVDTSISFLNLQADHKLFVPVSLIREQWLKNSESEHNFEFADLETIKKLNNSFRSVDIFYPDSPALEASFFIRSAFSIDALKELLVVKEQIISLDLSYMPIKDIDLEIIGEFKNLERLNLNFTDIDGSGLGKLSLCKSLKSLSLAGTHVNGDFLWEFVEADDLDVFLWETQASFEREDSLPENITIHYGYSVTDEDPIALNPPLLIGNGMIKTNEKVELEHNFLGVEIRFTTDNTTPDSLSEIYIAPFDVDNYATVRTIALKDGWLQSRESSFEIFKYGFRPDSLKLMTLPDPKNSGLMEQTLVDFEKGEISDFKTTKWLGYREHPMELWIDFGNKPVRQIVLTYGVLIGSYIMPPEKVELWASDDNKNFRLIEQVKILQPEGYESSVKSLVDFKIKNDSRYCKLKVFPVKKLPEWHNAKGEKGWIFIDELFLY